MSTLKILEHTSSSYAPRTWVNAASADITIALAMDYSTAGERLTHKAAGAKYLALPLEHESISNARSLYIFMKSYKMKTINVAGNGIYTLNKHGFDQAKIDLYVFNLLEILHQYLPIEHICSGGQTGVDIAGAKAGYKLGIDTEVLLPKGFKQRFSNGVDVDSGYESIYKQITGG